MKPFSIAFDYKNSKGEDSKRIIKVQHVAQDEIGRFYLTGFCLSKKSVRTFRTDRMANVVITGTGELLENQENLLNAIKTGIPNLVVGAKAHHYKYGFLYEISDNPIDIMRHTISAGSDSEGKQERLIEVLKNPFGGTPCWAFWLPPCFNQALDIRITPRVLEEKEEATPTWTQGSGFYFHVGDFVFNKERNGRVWSDELKEFSTSIQVLEARPAMPELWRKDKEKNGAWTLIAPRDSGFVRFSIWKVKKDKSCFSQIGEKTTTQDGFVKMLICGLEDDFGAFKITSPGQDFFRQDLH